MAKAPKAAYDTYDYDTDDSYAPKGKATKVIRWLIMAAG